MENLARNNYYYIKEKVAVFMDLNLILKHRIFYSSLVEVLLSSSAGTTMLGTKGYKYILIDLINKHNEKFTRV